MTHTPARGGERVFPSNPITQWITHAPPPPPTDMHTVYAGFLERCHAARLPVMQCR